jgi:hypothetical protein
MMKNFLISTLLIFLLGNLCHFGLPWWGIVPIAFFVAWALPQAGWSAFSSGLLAGMLLWGVSAALLNTANGGMFSAKIGQIFQGLRSTQLLYVTALLGGLLAAFGALTGRWASDLRTKPSQRDHYARRKRSGKYR